MLPDSGLAPSERFPAVFDHAFAHASVQQYHGSMDRPTLLRRPNDDPLIARVEEVLPGSPADYTVIQVGDAWSVVHIPTGEEIYAGLGPVEVFRSTAPF